MTSALAGGAAKARDVASPGVTGRNREFLPAAIEILETPASPLPVALMLTICAFFTLAVAWSFIGRLDVNAIAPGKLEATGRVKVIQSLDPGKIAAIHAENGAPREGRRSAARARSGGSRSPTSAPRATRSTPIWPRWPAVVWWSTPRAPRNAPPRRTARRPPCSKRSPPIRRARSTGARRCRTSVRRAKKRCSSADLTQIADALRALDKQIAAETGDAAAPAHEHRLSRRR